MSDPFLIVATPCYGQQVTQPYFLSMLAFQKACIRRGLRHQVHTVGGESLITRARNNLLHIFRTTPEAAHLLFIDADISFDPEEIFTMFDGDVVGGIYPLKQYNWDKVRAPSRRRQGRSCRRPRLCGPRSGPA